MKYFVCGLFPGFKFYRRLCGGMLISVEDLLLAQNGSGIKRKLPHWIVWLPAQEYLLFPNSKFLRLKSFNSVENWARKNVGDFPDNCQICSVILKICSRFFLSKFCILSDFELKMKENVSNLLQVKVCRQTTSYFRNPCPFQYSFIKLKRISNVILYGNMVAVCTFCVLGLVGCIEIC